MRSAVARDSLRTGHRSPDGGLAVRLRVSHLVGSADFEPSELSPAAILIVRRLSDPLPRGLPAGDFSLSASRAWERAARSTLGQVARSAVRPARGAVPSNANAVLFADQAELLACFSRDYLRGEAVSLWWWRAMIRSLPGTGSRSLLELWRREIVYVPAVVARLTEVGDIGWVLRSFTSEQARTILQDVALAFHLSHVLAVAHNFPARRNGEADRNEFARPVSAMESHGVQDRPRNRQVSPTSWGASQLGPVGTLLSREHTALLQVSHKLCNSPAEVRSGAFAGELEGWWRAEIAESRGTSEGTARHSATIPFEDTDSISQLSIASGAGTPEAIASSTLSSDQRRYYDHLVEANGFSKELNLQITSHSIHGVQPNEDSAPHLQTAAERGVSYEVRTADPTLSKAPLLQPEFKREYLEDHTVRIEPPVFDHPDPSTQLSGSNASLEQPSMIAQVEATLQAGDCVFTELGGAFFLVPVITSLGIPQSLERECNCELGLGSWECLELIARCLLGASSPDLTSDPVWALLAILDGRSPEEYPGKRFRPTSLYRLPKQWLVQEQTYPGTAAVRVCGNRCEVWTSLGFSLMDAWFNHPPSVQDVQDCVTQSYLTSFRNIPRSWAGARALGKTLEKPLQRFMAFLMPYVRWRLADALGSTAHRRIDFAKLLLSRTAKVWMTNTHVDVVLPLKQATSAVRMAGLDTDPGWVASFGRVIKFYFQ